MDLYVLDALGQKIGIINEYTSLQWYRRYMEAGSFVLHCSTAYSALLRQENIRIWPQGDREAGMVDSFEFQLDAEGKETLVVAGRLLTGMLGSRILWKDVHYSGSYELLMYQLANANATSLAVDADRRIKGLLAADPVGIALTVSDYLGARGTRLDVAMASLSKESEIGHRVRIDPASGILYFEVYQGLDRTAGQQANSPAIFSATYQNLESGQYRKSIATSANVALVAGTNNGGETVLATVGNAFGIARREMYVDASAIKQTLDDGTVLTASQFAAALRQLGQMKLTEAAPVESADAKISTTDGLQYKAHYDLGDIVTVRFENWGISANVRLTEIQEITETDGTNVYAVFGKDAWLPLVVGG